MIYGRYLKKAHNNYFTKYGNTNHLRSSRSEQATTPQPGAGQSKSERFDRHLANIKLFQTEKSEGLNPLFMNTKMLEEGTKDHGAALAGRKDEEVEEEK